MKRIKQLLILGGCLALIFGLLTGCGGNGEKAAAPQQLALGGTSSSSGAYTGVVAVAKAINQNQKKVFLNVVETGASVDNLKRASKSEFKMALVTHDSLARAYYGKGEFKETPVPNARLLFYIEEIPHTVFVRKDSGVKSLADLTGKKFSAGLTGSATESLAKRLFEVLEIKPDWYPGNTAALVEAVKNNRIIGFVKSGGPDSAVLDVASTTPIQLLPVTPEDLERANKLYPGEYVPGKVPAGAYPGQTEPVPSFSFWFGFFGTTEIPEDVAYAMTKALWEGRQSVAEAYPRAKEVINAFPEITVKYASIPLHPGAVRFYRELGVTIPDRLIPKE